MGTYTRIYLKNPKRNAEKVNNILKEWGVTYQIFNNVEYGLFYTQQMLQEDIRYMNEDEEGKKQVPYINRPITKEIFYKLTIRHKEVGMYMVKISCPFDDELKDIEVLKNFLKSEDAEKYINFKKTEYLERLINF